MFHLAPALMVIVKMTMTSGGGGSRICHFHRVSGPIRYRVDVAPGSFSSVKRATDSGCDCSRSQRSGSKRRLVRSRVFLCFVGGSAFVYLFPRALPQSSFLHVDDIHAVCRALMGVFIAHDSMLHTPPFHGYISAAT